MRKTFSIEDEARALEGIRRSLDLFDEGEPVPTRPARRKAAESHALMPGWVPAWDRPGALDPRVPAGGYRKLPRLRVPRWRRDPPRMGEGRVVQGQEYVAPRKDVCPW